MKALLAHYLPNPMKNRFKPAAEKRRDNIVPFLPSYATRSSLLGLLSVAGVLGLATFSSQAAVVLPTSAQSNTTASNSISVTIAFDASGNVTLSGAGNVNAAPAPVFAFDGNPTNLATDTLTATSAQAGSLTSPYVGSFTLTFEAFTTYNASTGLGTTAAAAANGFAHNNTGIGVNGTVNTGNTGIGEAMVVSVSGLSSGYTLVLTQLGLGNYTINTDNSVTYNSAATTFTNTTTASPTFSATGVTATAGHWFTLAQTAGDGIRMDTLTFDIVPEPSTALLGGLGLLALLRRRR